MSTLPAELFAPILGLTVSYERAVIISMSGVRGNKLARKDPKPEYAPPETKMTTSQLSTLLANVNKGFNDLSKSLFYKQTTFVFDFHPSHAYLIGTLKDHLTKNGAKNADKMIQKITTVKILLANSRDNGPDEYGKGWEDTVQDIVISLPGLQELVLVPFLSTLPYEELITKDDDEDETEQASETAVTVKAARDKCLRILKSVAFYEADTCPGLKDGTAYQLLYRNLNDINVFNPYTQSKMVCEFSLRKGESQRLAGAGLKGDDFRTSIAKMVSPRAPPFSASATSLETIAHHVSMNSSCHIPDAFPFPKPHRGPCARSILT
jgi:hypothetical protein